MIEMKQNDKRELLNNFSEAELQSIYKSLNCWEWDARLGKPPVMFEALERYKKPHSIRRRFESLFRAIWPFTKSDYVEPIMREIRVLLAERSR